MGQPAGEKGYMAVYLNKDYPPLTVWYRLIFALSVLSHLFIPAISLHQHQQRLIIAGSIFVHCLQNAYQLRSLGYATTRQVASAVALIILGTAFLGPMAVYSGFWYWREHVIYALSK